MAREPKAPRVDGEPEPTTFLNVDLDLWSGESLAPLAEELGSRLVVLHVGRVGRRYLARFELRSQPKDPEAAVRRLAAAIERLPVRHQATWRRARSRDFNIGIQAGAQPYHSEFTIGSATLAVVAKLGGRIVVTVYGSGIASVSSGSEPPT